MTVLTQPRPGDTGEILIGEQTADLGPTVLLRPMTAPPAPTVERADGPTTLIPPMLLRRAAADPTVDTGPIELPAVATGAEMAVAARFTTAPTAPPRPLPPVPAPKPSRALDDQAAAQPISPPSRVLDTAATPNLWTRLTYTGKHRAGAR